MEKTKKLLSTYESVKAVWWVGEDLWWEEFVEKVCFKFRLQGRLASRGPGAVPKLRAPPPVLLLRYHAYTVSIRSQQ